MLTPGTLLVLVMAAPLVGGAGEHKLPGDTPVSLARIILKTVRAAEAIFEGTVTSVEGEDGCAVTVKPGKTLKGSPSDGKDTAIVDCPRQWTDRRSSLRYELPAYAVGDRDLFATIDGKTHGAKRLYAYFADTPLAKRSEHAQMATNLSDSVNKSELSKLVAAALLAKEPVVSAMGLHTVYRNPEGVIPGMVAPALLRVYSGGSILGRHMAGTCLTAYAGMEFRENPELQEKITTIVKRRVAEFKPGSQTPTPGTTDTSVEIIGPSDDDEAEEEEERQDCNGAGQTSLAAVGVLVVFWLTIRGRWARRSKSRSDLADGVA